MRVVPLPMRSKLSSIARRGGVALVACAFALAAAPISADAAAIHVTSLADSGPGTLRDAIETASPGSTIIVPAGTIKLTTGELDVNKKLEIDGAGSGATTVSGNDASQVFSLAGAAGVKITKLAIVHGRVAAPMAVLPAAGIVIDSTSSLTLDSVRVADHVADSSGDATHLAGIVEGGAILNRGTLVIVRSAVDHNTARSDGTVGDQPGGVVSGAAISNYGTLSVTDSSISKNTASAIGHGTKGGGIVSGGVLYTQSGSVLFRADALNGNVARADGGATGAGGTVTGGVVQNSGANLTLTRTSIIGNTASAVGHSSSPGGVVNAGGVYNNGDDLSITDGVIDGNIVFAAGGAAGGAGGTIKGGGVYHTGDALTIARTRVSHNTTSATGGTGASGGHVNGAGVYDSSAAPNVTSITSSRVVGNSTNADAGANGNALAAAGIGMYLDGYQVTVVATTVAGNHGTARGQGSGAGGSAPGGGIYAGVPATMTNVTVSRNGLDAAGGTSGTGGIAEGGGIYANGAITLVNSTIADSSVRAPGMTPGTARGGNLAHAVVVTHVKNAIVSGGQADSGYENCREPFTSNGHNIDSLNQCGFTALGDEINTNPLLMPLAFNGGPVPTRALLPGSPAINKGDNVGCPSTDARGAPRPAFGICDIGAFEVQPAPVITGLKIKPKRFEAQRKGPTTSAKHKHKPRGTTVSYSDSRAALTTFAVLKPRPGVFKGTVCVPAPKKKKRHKHVKRCVLFARVGRFLHQDLAGANNFHFSGRIKRHKLAPGRYLLTASPSLWAVTGNPKAAVFKIIP